MAESTMDLEAHQELVKQLGAGERLLWAGRPRQGILLRPADALLIPFSLFWGGFAFFMEYSAITSGPLLMGLFGIPFVLAGVYLIVGRFFIEARQRARTFYGLTNERVLIATDGFRRTLRSINLRTLGEITLSERPNGDGSLTFGPVHPMQAWAGGNSWPGFAVQLSPTFDSIPSAREVYESIRSTQRELSR